MTFRRYDSFSKHELLNMVVYLVAVGDPELIDNRRCFPCMKGDHPTWQHLRDVFVRLLVDYDYSKSPEFQDTLVGKSPAYVRVATRLAREKSKKRRHELSELLCNLLDTDDAFDLIPVSLHDAVREAKSRVLDLA
jgi:hypothetical protein